MIRTQELAGVGESPDPAGAFAAAGRRERFVWLQPERNFRLVGLGVTIERRTQAGASIADCLDSPEGIFEVLQPSRGPDGGPEGALVLYGGFGFYTGSINSRTGASPRMGCDWADFPASCLVLPEILGIDRGEGLRWFLTIPGEASRSAAQDAEARALDLLRGGAELARGRVGIPAEYTRSEAREDAYRQVVAAALREIDDGRFTKVVPARRATVRLAEGGARPAVVREMLLRLADRFRSATTFAVGRGGGTLLGATPELLLRIGGRNLETAALAGSRPLAGDARDNEVLSELLCDPKELFEHAAVAGHLYERLASAGVRFEEAPGSPSVRRLPGIAHLSTTLRGRADFPPGEIWRLAARLHPTPAIGGLPTGEALRFLSTREDFDRGWFAAPLGWSDLKGNGEVALALRCGLLREGSREMGIFAGAGVVEGSTPSGELAETEAKLGAILSVLDLAEPPV